MNLAIVYDFFFFFPTFDVAKRFYSSAQTSTAAGMQTKSSSIFSLPTVPIQMYRIDITTPLSASPLETAISPLSSFFFSHSAKPDHSALHMAIRRPQSDSSRFPIIALLLSQGADINALETGMKGRPTSSALVGPLHQSTVLFKALSAKDVEMVRFLIEQGADPKLKILRGERRRACRLWRR